MNIQTLYIIIGILSFFCLFLLVVIYFIREHNAELVSIAEQIFENEQRLANKLDNNYKALVNSNIWLEKLNTDGRLNILVQQNKIILKNNLPEQLEH